MMDDSDSLPQDHRPYDEGGRLPLMRGRTKVSELSTYWATFWSVVAIILSVLLLVAYGAIMRYIKVSQSLDRLERSVGLLSKGQGVGGVSRIADDACLEVARSQSEVAPLVWVIRSVVEPSWPWLEPAMQSVWAERATVTRAITIAGLDCPDDCAGHGREWNGRSPRDP
ncbi:MAG: hypothetical protein EB145_07265 [Proteobacteria bacterium]|nr:hypothetical protein [Pseudomonadota bacterium]